MSKAYWITCYGSIAALGTAAVRDARIVRGAT
jgi:hypothetical protein